MYLPPSGRITTQKERAELQKRGGKAMYKILIVEDDLTIARILKGHLGKWNYEVEYVEDFKNVMEKVSAFSPDLILMDISLPFYNGFHWCQEIRKVTTIPVIFISSSADNMNIVMAMNMGGDDFIEKPFDLDVITAKIQAMFRRSYAYQGTINVVEHGGLLLNLKDASFLYNDEKVELTKNEFRILEVLLENSGKIVSRDELMKRLWETDSFVDDNTLTVNVTRLRKKLANAGLADYIKTKKGIGYLVE